MTAIARVRAQAKVNLLLRILAREQSGYHSLETIFARIALADDVSVRATPAGRSVDCIGADVGPAESNLAYRAAEAYAAATGWPSGFAIEITKHIPVGGGLGGGSADAGAVLRGLNALAPRPVASPALLEIAGILGADVPFMALDAPLALGWGRGDRLLALPALPAAAMQLAVFDFGVSSTEAYGWVAAARQAGAARRCAGAMNLAALSSWAGIAALAANDFEVVVGLRHSAIARALEAARGAGALVAQLSGSGATVFAIPGPGAEHRPMFEPRTGTIIETTTAVSVEDVVVTG